MVLSFNLKDNWMKYHISCTWKRLKSPAFQAGSFSARGSPRCIIFSICCSNIQSTDLVNGGRKSIIFLDIFYRFYRFFTDLNYKPFAGWGTRPEICQLTTKLLLGNSTAGLLQGFKPNRDICLG